MSRNIIDGIWHKSLPKSFTGDAIPTGHAELSKGKAAAPVVTDFEQQSGVIAFPVATGIIGTLKKSGNFVAYHDQYAFLIDNPSNVSIDVVLRRYVLPTDGATITTVVGTFAVGNASQSNQTYANLSGDVYAEFSATVAPSGASTISYSVVLF